MEGFLLYLVCYDVGFILYDALAVIWFFARGAVKDRRATARVAPTKAQQEVQWAGDRKGRPYESVTRGTMSGRPQGSPLRRVTRSAMR